MRMQMNNLTLLLFCGLLISSCSYKVDKVAEEKLQLDGANLSFAQVRSLAFGPKCARCHDWVASYSETKALAQEISDRVQGIGPFRQMPPATAAQLTANEKAAIVAWVAAGAPEVPGQIEQPVTPPPEAPPAEPPPVEPTPEEPPPEAPPLEPPPRLNFDLVKTKVFAAKCLRCHSTELETFEQALPLIKEIEFRIQDIGGMFQMPPPNRPQLTDEEKNLVLEWIRLGAPKD